jgi:hypothetical protein
MTVTILPGHDMQADPDSAPSPQPSRPRVSKSVVAAAAAVALAAVGGGAWVLTRSDATPVAATPTQVTSHPTAAAVTLPPHGRVPAVDLRAVATPAFAAMASSLGGWTTNGHVHRAAQDSAGPSDSKFNRCAGVAAPSARQRGVSSGKYESGNHVVQGQIDVTPSAAAARRDLATMIAPRAEACAKALLPQMVRHQKLGKYVTATQVSLHRLQAVPHAFRMRLAVSYVVNGHQVPVQMDFVGALVGRAEVSMVVTSHDSRLRHSREVAALRAMTKQVRHSLR